MTTEKRRERNTTILEWFDTLVLALTLILVILLFVVRTITVDGRSMDPTLRNGEQVLVLSAFYTPQRGDIVVVDSYTAYGAPLVKRVIAVAGDIVDIDYIEDTVYINGQRLDEAYLTYSDMQAGDVVFPLTVPEGMVFLMGDNRPLSLDSRDSRIGFVDERDILGKVIFRIFPSERFGVVE